MTMRQPGIPASRKLLDVNIFDNLFRTNNSLLFSFFEFVKPSND
jgi:hypothetical protein